MRVYDKEYAVEQFKSGKSMYSISKELGVSKPVIRKMLIGRGFNTSSKSTWTNNVRLKDKLPEIKKLADEGLSSGEIARKLGYSQSNVWKLLDKAGYSMTENKFTYDVDLNFFDNIDTAEKAYILGWWYADGNVVHDKIRLQICDKEILEYIKEQIKYSGPIKIIEPTIEGRKTQYLLLIARREIVLALEKLGCPENKSLILNFPSSDIVPLKFISNFILGWFDGDGNIYYYKAQNKWRIQLVGTREFLEGLKNIIGVEGYWSQRFPERENNNWCFHIAVQSDVIKFLEFIYLGNPYSLNRKREQAIECVKDLKKRKGGF